MSKTIVRPSGLTSTLDQVVSVVSMGTSDHDPGGALTSHLGAGFSLSRSLSRLASAACGAERAARQTMAHALNVIFMVTPPWMARWPDRRRCTIAGNAGSVYVGGRREFREGWGGSLRSLDAAGAGVVDGRRSGR